MTVTSDDPVNPQFRLSISGTVEVAVGFEPERLSLGDVLTNETIVKEVKLVGKKAKDVEIKELISSDPALFSAKIVKKAKEPTIAVTITTGAASRRFGGVITVKTGLESPAEVTMRIDGRATADISVDRDRVHFFYDETGKSTADVIVYVSSIKGTKFEVKGIEDPQNLVEGKVEKVGERYKLTLSLKEGKQVNNTALMILTDQKGDAEKLEVVYSARAQTPQRPNVAPPANAPEAMNRRMPSPLLKLNRAKIDDKPKTPATK